MPSTGNNSEPSLADSLSLGRAMAIVFLPFAIGYFFSYFFRVVNAVVAPDLIADIGLNATQLGLLSAVYFFTFAVFQIPLGVLLDRFGPRSVQGTLYLVAGTGVFLFSIAESVITLMLSRGMIGLGVSGGLMATLKAIVQWFPKRRYALVNGFVIVAGAIGTLAATAPLEFTLRYMDWRMLFVMLSVATLGAGMLILYFVPDKPKPAAVANFGAQLSEVGKIYKSSFFWSLVPLMFTCGSANMAIQGLWAASWLSDVADLERAVVANHLLVMAVAMLLGALLQGVIASALQGIGLSLINICALACVANILVLLSISFRVLDAHYVLWAAHGFFGVQTILVFATLAHHFPETLIGRVNTAANVLVFGMAFVYQFGIGAIIALWSADADGVYPERAYFTAFLVVVATQALGLVWNLLSVRKSEPHRIA